MKELITYFIGTLVCSGVLVALYSLLLERRVKFTTCRLYLPSAIILAAIIPALRIPVWDGETIYMQAPVSVGEINATAEIVADEPFSISPAMLCTAVWALGTLLMLGTMLSQLVRMHRFRRKAASVDFGDFLLLKINDKISSFSFFRTIFVGADTPADDLKVIIAHEAGHIRHHHSVERIVMELLKAAMWWNPFVWIAARRLTEVQEYEADSEVLLGGCNIDWYINTLLKNLFGYSPDIANGLRDSLTKKRLKMMTMKKDGRYALLRMAAIVPVVAGLITAFSFTAKATQVIYPQPDEAKPLVVVDGKVYNESLETLDTDVIKSITVLKNEAAKEAYAHLGDVSDGVIVIETKEEDKEGAKEEAADKADIVIVGTGSVKKPEEGLSPMLMAEQMPTFKGGDLLTFREWVMRNVRFPQEALENGIYGRVAVSFVIDKEGKLGNIMVLASPDDILSQEVVRVLALSPAWTPGRDGGETVSVKFTIPVDFAVSTDNGLQRDESPASEGSVPQISVVGFK